MKTMKRIISVFLIVMLALGCLTAAVHAETVKNEKEANNSPETANDFDLSSPIKGALADENDKDWYAISLGNSIGLVTFTLNHAGTGSDAIYFKVSVYAEADTATAVGTFSAKGSATATSSEPILVPGGKYYVLVEVGTAIEENYEYKLSAKVDSNLNSEVEENDQKSQANEIKTANGYSSDYYGSVAYTAKDVPTDVDYFKFNSQKGYFSIEFVALTENVTYNVTIYAIPGEEYTLYKIGQFSVKASDCVVTDSNKGGYYVGPNIGVAAGTYFVSVTANNNGANTGGYTGDALYKLRVYNIAGTKSECELNNDKDSANTLEAGKPLYGSISYATDKDYYKVTTKSGETEYKVVISADKDTNGDTASWKVTLIDSDGKNVTNYIDKVVNMKDSVEIDMNGLKAGTYYVIVSYNTQTNGDYKVSLESFKSDETPEPEGNFFQRIAARIKAMDWTGFWQNNFKPLLDAIGGPEGALKVLWNVLQLSIGSIIKLNK